MKKGTTTYSSVKLSAYPYGTEFVATQKNRDIELMIPNEKFLDLLVMLDMAYAMADGADDEHTKAEISLMVVKLIRQYREAQGLAFAGKFEWYRKCHEINNDYNGDD